MSCVIKLYRGKRSIHVIQSDTLPQESKEAYQKGWDEFLAFVGENRSLKKMIIYNTLTICICLQNKN